MKTEAYTTSIIMIVVFLAVSYAYFPPPPNPTHPTSTFCTGTKCILEVKWTTLPVLGEKRTRLYCALKGPFDRRVLLPVIQVIG